jgi:glucosamine--fructose-6-phosphate aminotransferase (isomerizing)
VAAPMKSLFEAEIHEQPAALMRLLQEGRSGVDRIAAAVRAYAPRFVMVAARGSSDNAARYAQYLFGVRNRLAVGLAAPSLFTHYDAAPSLESALVLGISQSGQSPDIVEVLNRARSQGALTVAITNDPIAPLAEAAEHQLPLLAGKERAVAATKTYTTQLLALAMLSAAMEGSAEDWDELRALPDQVSETIDLNQVLADSASRLAESDRMVVVGRGFNLSTAFEIALKIKETSYVMADPYSSADFQHGPIAMLDESLPLLVVAPGQKSVTGMSELLSRAHRVGAPLVALTDQPDLKTVADAVLSVPGEVPEWLSPVTSVVAGQLWAHALTRARGLDPDAPRGLAKVTLTR